VLALAVFGSIAGLALGALIHGLGRGRGRAVVDGIVLGAIPLLIAVRVIPHVYEELGRAALGFVALGFFALAFGDRHGHEGGEKFSRAVLVPTLFVHALADGAALALAAAGGGDHGDSLSDHGHDHGHSHGVEPVHGDAHDHAYAHDVAQARWVLVLAIIAHRLPEGLLVCAALVPSLGWKKTIPRLSGIALATLVGAVAGRSLLAVVPDKWLDAVVAFGIGAMVRLAVHTHDRSEPSPRERALAGVAFLAAIGSVLMLPDPDSVLARAQPMELSVARSLLPLFIETAPAMALAMLAMLVARVWGVSKSWLTSALFSSGQREGGAWLARAQREGTGQRMALWGAFAAAALGFDALVLSLGWFGLAGSSVRWLVAAALPLVWIGSNPPEIERHLRTDTSDPVRALASNAGWYAVGLLGGAVLEAALATRSLEALTGVQATLAAVLLAMAVPVPMTAAIALAAVTVHKGAGVDAALAWLWVTSLRGALSSSFWSLWVKREATSVIVRFIVATTIAVLLALGIKRSGVVVFPELHPRLAHAHVPFEWVCVGISAVVLLGILLRLGPRAVLEAMAERRAATPEVHLHDHQDEHGHSHEHDGERSEHPEALDEHRTS
jgi:hypothetical protein